MNKLTLLILLSLLVLSFTTSIVDEPSEENKSLYVVLLFKWREDAPKEKISIVFDLWYGLTQKVEGFENISSYELLTGEYDQVVILKFTSNEAHENYLGHRDHRQIAEIGSEIVLDFASYSYWKE